MYCGFNAPIGLTGEGFELFVCACVSSDFFEGAQPTQRAVLVSNRGSSSLSFLPP